MSAPVQGPTMTERYLSVLPDGQRKALELLRTRILKAVPGIEEHFAYGMPAFRYHGKALLYIGAAKNHCALYGSVPPGFKEQLKDFKTSKGAIQFTPEAPLPAALVKAIVMAKVEALQLA